MSYNPQVDAPWAKIPMSLVRDPNMARGDLLVYALLDYRAGKRGWFWGAQIDFATELNIGLRSVNRSVQKLEVAGYIATRQGGMKRHNRRIYYVLSRTVDVPPRTTDLYATHGVEDTPPMAQTKTQTPATDTTRDDDPAALALDGSVDSQPTNPLQRWMDWWTKLQAGHDYPLTPALASPASYFRRCKGEPPALHTGHWRYFIKLTEVARRAYLPQAPAMSPLVLPNPSYIRRLLPIVDRVWEADGNSVLRHFEALRALRPETSDYSDALQVLAEQPRVYNAAFDAFQPPRGELD